MARPTRSKTSTSRTRKFILVLIVSLTVFLLGTVVVLSSISYYLAIPTWAYLTEEEVPWLPDQVIKPLRDTTIIKRISTTKAKELFRRQDFEEINEEVINDENALGEETIASIWEGILGDEGISTTRPPVQSASSLSLTAGQTKPPSDVDQTHTIYDEDEVHNPNPTYGFGGWSSSGNSYKTMAKAVTDTEEMDAEEEEAIGWDDEVIDGGAEGGVWEDWGADGKGSGGYWMREDWDGRVQGTDSWERLLNVSTRPGESIPRIIHQTWKNNLLPQKWQKAWKECREGLPDYEYMLWTDSMSRNFIEIYYPSHLPTFDSYKYPIQRADAIRYFILHKFGGIYMDLDIGCRRKMDPLLQGDWEVILPITKPVGISNDLIFSSKGSAFMEQTVDGLAGFNHEYVINYPTVMFSTGPMFLSAQYSIYSSAHPLTATYPRAQVRILPKSLYGKNAPIALVPHSFFSHFYGSSWHADDAGFIAFLGTWGKNLMVVGGVVIVLGVFRLVYSKSASAGGLRAAISGIGAGAGGGQYQLVPVLPTSVSDFDNQSPNSPTFDTLALAPGTVPGDIVSTLRKASNLILAVPTQILSSGSNNSPTGTGRTGLLYFVPAIFLPASPTKRGRRHRTASSASGLPRRSSFNPDDEMGAIPMAPPPYERESSEHTIRPRSPRDTVGKGMEEVDEFLREEGRLSSETEDGREWADWERDEVER